MTRNEALACILREQEAGWRSGHSAPAEYYQGVHPWLRGDHDASLEIVLNEYKLRLEFGKGLKDEILSRFAGLRPDLDTLLATFDGLESGDLERLIRQPPSPRELDPPVGTTATGSSADGRPQGIITANASANGAATKGTSVVGRGYNPRITGYEVKERLGEGANGEVWKAWSYGRKQHVALKLINPILLDLEEQIARFRREGEILANLDGHPNIVPVYDCGVFEGTPYISMRLFSPGSLKKHLSRYSLRSVLHDGPSRRWPTKIRNFLHLRRELRRRHVDIACRFAEIAKAIHHVHQRGILHRDLKPANILVADDAQWYVADFGLAKRIDGNAAGSLDRSLAGTPHYSSPEHFDPPRTGLTPASDVYSLGVILYEILAERRIFPDDCPAHEIRERVLDKSNLPIAPRSLNEAIDPDLEAICLKCLDKLPERRYQSALEFANDLNAFVEYSPLEARPVGWTQRARLFALHSPGFAAMSSVAALLGLALVTGGVASGVHIVKRRDAEISARKLAAEQRNLALEAIHGLVYQVQDQLRDRPGMKPLRENLLNRALDGLRKVAHTAADATEVDPSIVSAHRQIGEILRNSGRTEEALSQFERTLALAQSWDEALRAERPTEGAGQLMVLNILGDLSGTSEQLGRLDPALSYRLRQADLCESLWGLNGGDTDLAHTHADVHRKLGHLYRRIGDSASADVQFGKSLMLMEELVQRDQDNGRNWTHLEAAFQDLGDLSLADKKPAKARLYFSRAMEIANTQASKAPQDSSRRRDLAVAHLRLALVDEAENGYVDAQHHLTKALDILKKESAEDPSDFDLLHRIADAHLQKSLVAQGLNDHKAAREDLEESRTIIQQLIKADPGNAEFVEHLVKAENIRGDILLQDGNPQGALESLGTSLAHLESLAGLAEGQPGGIPKPSIEGLHGLPSSVESALGIRFGNRGAYLEQLGNVQRRIAEIFASLKQTDEAEVAYRRALQHWDHLAATQPENLDAALEAVEIRFHLKDFADARDDLTAAAQTAREIGERITSIMRLAPGDHDERVRLGVIRINQASMFERAGAAKDAEAAYRDAIVRLEPERDGDLGDQVRSFLARALKDLGEMLGNVTPARTDEAVDFLNRAITAWHSIVEEKHEKGEGPRMLATTLATLGDALKRADRLEPAIDAYRRSLAQFAALADKNHDSSQALHDLADTHQRLGRALLRRGDYDEALRSQQADYDLARRLVEVNPDNTHHRRHLAIALDNLAMSHRVIGRHDRSLELHRSMVNAFEVIQKEHSGSRDPIWDLVLAYSKLGDAALDASDAAAASEACQRAVQLHEPLAVASGSSSDWVKQAELYERLASSYMIAGKFLDAIESCRRGISICQGPLAKSDDRADDRLKVLDRLKTLLVAGECAPRAMEDLEFAGSRPTPVAKELLALRARVLIPKGPSPLLEDAIDRIVRLAPEDPNNLYSAACLFARVAATSLDAADQLAPTVIRNTDRYVERSMELLKEALKRGYKEPDAVLLDPDLAILRRRTDQVDSLRRLISEVTPDNGR